VNLPRTKEAGFRVDPHPLWGALPPRAGSLRPYIHQSLLKYIASFLYLFFCPLLVGMLFIAILFENLIKSTTLQLPGFNLSKFP